MRAHNQVSVLLFGYNFIIIIIIIIITIIKVTVFKTKKTHQYRE